MDHSMSAQRFEANRRAACVPPIAVGGRVVADRLDRHLALIAPAPGAAMPTRAQASQAAQLILEITPRPAAVSAPPRRRLSLRAPLRSFKRWIGFQ
jgi:hypothetical protein